MTQHGVFGHTGRVRKVPPPGVAAGEGRHMCRVASVFLANEDNRIGHLSASPAVRLGSVHSWGLTVLYTLGRPKVKGRQHMVNPLTPPSTGGILAVGG